MSIYHDLLEVHKTRNQVMRQERRAVAPRWRKGVPVASVQETTIRGLMVETVEENEGF
jgi:hypothetical protein